VLAGREGGGEGAAWRGRGMGWGRGEQVPESYSTSRVVTGYGVPIGPAIVKPSLCKCPFCYVFFLVFLFFCFFVFFSLQDYLVILVIILSF
jgi:hypothetical protein